MVMKKFIRVLLSIAGIYISSQAAFADSQEDLLTALKGRNAKCLVPVAYSLVQDNNHP